MRIEPIIMNKGDVQVTYQPSWFVEYDGEADESITIELRHHSSIQLTREQWNAISTMVNISIKAAKELHND